MSTEMPVSDADMRARYVVRNTTVDGRIQHLKHPGIGHEVMITMPVRWCFVRAALHGLVMRRPLLLRVLLPDDDA